MKGGICKGMALGAIAGMIAGMAVLKTAECSETGRKWMRKGKRMMRSVKEMF